LNTKRCSLSVVERKLDELILEKDSNMQASKFKFKLGLIQKMTETINKLKFDVNVTHKQSLKWKNKIEKLETKQKFQLKKTVECSILKDKLSIMQQYENKHSQSAKKCEILEKKLLIITAEHQKLKERLECSYKCLDVKENENRKLAKNMKNCRSKTKKSVIRIKAKYAKLIASNKMKNKSDLKIQKLNQKSILNYEKSIPNIMLK